MISLVNYNCKRTSCCILNTNRSNYSVYGKAKGAKTNYRLSNPDKYSVDQYTIDDCVLQEIKNESKCDYLFIINKKTSADGYFIEMKGSDLNKACEQIYRSIESLNNNITGNIFARVVTTKISTPNYNQEIYYKKLKRSLGNNFRHNNTILEDTV